MNTNIDKYDMEGPFPLDSQSINNEVEKAIGVYILGKNNDVKSFKPRYVGRSDNNLNKRLHDHEKENYTHFMYLYAGSIKDAFEMECRLFHMYGQEIILDNKKHPDRPGQWIYLSCPVCEIFDSFLQ
jgi:hypothetical protein